MKSNFLAAMMVFLALAMTGCGDNHPRTLPTVVTDILSDPAFDGDIEVSSLGTTTITQGNPGSVFAGINPSSLTEFRAFLDFPLSGPGGVPGNAVIVSAVLDIVVDSVSTTSPDGTVPIRIDLVSFQPPTLVASDFDRTAQQALATMTFSPPISTADVGQHVAIDVTPLMVEAQNRGLANFQVRILEDLGPVSPGIIEIDDTTPDLAPLLEVTYQ